MWAKINDDYGFAETCQVFTVEAVGEDQVVEWGGVTRETWHVSFESLPVVLFVWTKVNDNQGFVETCQVFAFETVGTGQVVDGGGGVKK